MDSSLTNRLTRDLKVKKRIEETPEAVSFVLDIPANLKEEFQYQAGQFVTLFLNVNGEDLRRSYSLSSSPLADQDFQITVKRVPQGRGSNFLCDQVREGDTLKVTPPSGFFFEESQIKTPCQFFLFAAGSGVTPIFSILKHALLSHPENKVAFLFANRSQSQTIYRQQIEEWSRKYPDRLTVTHVLSRPEAPWEGPSGRCTEKLVKNFFEIQKASENFEVYICGPTGFMDLVQEGLNEAGVARQKIHIESFGDAPQADLSGTAFNEEGKVVVGDALTPGEKPEKLTALLNGEDIEIEVNPELSLLENLIEQGHNPPYSCMDGACMACMAKLKQGRVYQNDPGILTEENLEMREILTCQARPLSKNVVIDYDDL